jgi:hypothetical protein
MSASQQEPATSEWLRIMTEEVARKRDDAERARREQALRAAERSASAAGAGPTPGDAPAPTGPGRARRKSPR